MIFIRTIFYLNDKLRKLLKLFGGLLDNILFDQK